MKKVLITGVSGFAGSYLSRYLLLMPNLSVSGTFLFPESINNISDIKNKINLIKIDLKNSKKVHDMLKLLKPDLVFHLAAFTSPADSFSDPISIMVNNISSEINILEAIRENNLFDTRILIASSAEVYGKVDRKDLPIDENTKLMPTNPYAVSKISQDFLGLQYFLSYGIKVIRVRPFNHIGPVQSPSFVVASFAKKIAEIERGESEPVLSVGNLETERDFTDVRDMVRAYYLAIEKGEEGDVYNIGSGKSYKISEILNRLLALSRVKIKVVSDKSLFRPTDNLKLFADASKFIKITSWKPEVAIDTTLRDTLDYWRNIA